MTVETLLGHLRNERISALVSANTYCSEALKAMQRKDYDAAISHVEDSNKCTEKAKHIDMIITEIEKRVS